MRINKSSSPFQKKGIYPMQQNYIPGHSLDGLLSYLTYIDGEDLKLVVLRTKFRNFQTN